AFGVAPGTNASVIRQAQSVGLAFAPGIATASDIETAVELGCRELKFFPAEPSGGVKYLKSLAGPYAHLGLRFVPLGGLTAENVSGYLSLPQVTAVGGSWIAKREVIRQRNWQEIAENAAQARRIVEETRTSGDK
ncbi:MAG: keto-deoxy-phosphogluconate aldolase, partial [Planctomycetes bacterium]|nr:keto-deoxy-phosphogluconate aldolase [Planctomycetota bacterium]